MANKRKQDKAVSSSTDESKKKQKKADESKSSKDEKPWNMKIISWNVDGMRAWIKKGGLSIFEKEDADIVCLQETKCPEKKIPSEAKIKGYNLSCADSEQDGYAGVALYSKVKPISVKIGLGDEVHDKEGRLITAEFEKFYIVTSYVPNAGRQLKTLDKRMDWDPKFLKHLQDLDSKKPVIMCGDLNVAHSEIDLANPKTNKRNAGFTKEERDGFTTLLEKGSFVDSFRKLYPDQEDTYTFWSYMRNARSKNVGWRLDYFVLSERIMPKLSDNVILSSELGSDHCPISLLINMDE